MPNSSHIKCTLARLFRKRGYEVRDLFEKDPNLPIDLYCRKQIGIDPEEDTPIFGFYFVKISYLETISRTLRDLLSFLLYYLPFHVNPENLKVVLVVPSTTRVTRIDINFFKSKGLGLWKVYPNGETETMTEEIAVRERMLQEFNRRFSAVEDETLRRKSSEIIRFFDKYVHDSGDSIIRIYRDSPGTVGEKYIDKRLLLKMFKLDNVCFSNTLKGFIRSYLTEPQDDYQFVSETLDELWNKYVKIKYSEILATFDPVLQKVFIERKEKGVKAYRDHFLHQFHVFLLGNYIIDKIFEDFKRKYAKPDISWMVASTFHDIAYPVQLHDDITRIIFDEVFNISDKREILQLKPHFVEDSFLSCLTLLLSFLLRILYTERLKSHWMAEENDIVQFFHQKVTEEKHHAVLSALSLLKSAGGNNSRASSEKLHKILMPSALAIAIHHQDILQGLGRISVGRSRKRLLKLKFEQDPLSYLLVLCDSIQEWGRSREEKDIKSFEKEVEFKFKDIDFVPGRGFVIKMLTPTHSFDDEICMRRVKKILALSGLLAKPASFGISVWIEDKNEKRRYLRLRD